MAVTTIETSDAAQQRVYPRRAAVVSWIFFDWAAQPYFTLITTFVFAPYFAAHVAPDAASGQALWGFATAAAGIVIALDRQEVVDVHATPRRSAAQAVADAHGVPVVAVATLDDLLAFATRSTTLSCEHARLVDYRARYGSQQ
mgnify:CR=1 FL=1